MPMSPPLLVVHATTPRTLLTILIIGTDLLRRSNRRQTLLRQSRGGQVEESVSPRLIIFKYRQSNPSLFCTPNDIVCLLGHSCLSAWHLSRLLCVAIGQRCLSVASLSTPSITSRTIFHFVYSIPLRLCACWTTRPVGQCFLGVASPTPNDIVYLSGSAACRLSLSLDSFNQTTNDIPSFDSPSTDKQNRYCAAESTSFNAVQTTKL